ncbi:hypothetical protein HK097_003000 [Rhizophlyctis rosea]|uniref:Bacteriophage/plasmid primase P4 C-terminal domain-containing protein n=1 Tax=Rhizophlyctis rosea TaxID=64517 RepID=A0AAD5S450_9FUNG|nr:hypothetical protein HK097_003000 [Rhizophlyctis rosea]
MFMKYGKRMWKKLGKMEKDDEQYDDVAYQAKLAETCARMLSNHSSKTNVIKETDPLIRNYNYGNKMNANSKLIAFNNGYVFDMTPSPKSPQGIVGIRLTRKEDLVTLTTGYPYDSSIQPSKELIDFLRRIYPEDETFEYVISMDAQQLCGEGEHRLLCHHHTGEGANGKSAKAHLLMETLGNYAVAKGPIFYEKKKDTRNANNAQPSILNLPGVRQMHIQETSKGFIFNTAHHKDHSGGKKMMGRPLWQNEDIEFAPQFHVHMWNNSLVILDDMDRGVRRRHVAISYESHFVDTKEEVAIERKNGHKHVYVKMTEGDFNRKVQQEWKQQYMALLMSRFSHAFLKPSQNIVESTEKLFQRNDPVGTFVGYFYRLEDYDPKNPDHQKDDRFLLAFTDVWKYWKMDNPQKTQRDAWMDEIAARVKKVFNIEMISGSEVQKIKKSNGDGTGDNRRGLRHFWFGLGFSREDTFSL